MRAEKNPPLNANRRVVVVDGLPETETVLRAVLEPKGIAVSRCRRNRLPEYERTQPRPEVLVVHEESPKDLSASSWSDVPRVFIGRIEHDPSTTADERILANPFQYSELLSAIERTLSPATADSPESNILRAA